MAGSAILPQRIMAPAAMPEGNQIKVTIDSL